MIKTYLVATFTAAVLALPVITLAEGTGAGTGSASTGRGSSSQTGPTGTTGGTNMGNGDSGSLGTTTPPEQLGGNPNSTRINDSIRLNRANQEYQGAVSQHGANHQLTRDAKKRYDELKKSNGTSLNGSSENTNTPREPATR